MKRLALLFTLGLALPFLHSCDDLDPNERLEPIDPPTTAAKPVLIEDFTGQRCSNCPLAHEEVEKLQEIYGRENIIAVAIHGGPQAVDEGNAKVLGLANEEGKEYNRRLGSFAYPKGRIDRQGELLDFEKWNAAVRQRMALAPQVRLHLRDIVVDPAKQEFSFGCNIASDREVNGKLQVWLTESDIVAVQTLPAIWGGGNQLDYVHHHVFRAAVNGIDGEELHLEAGDEQQKDYTFPIQAHWNPAHLSLVVFYYNDKEGVLQVTDAPITQNI